MVLGAEVLVHRNDQITVDEARALKPTHLCISPGPGTPHDAGVSMQMIEAFAGDVPVFGVCLGPPIARRSVRRQSRARRRGSCTARLRWCITTAAAFSQGMPEPFEAGRYHSLIAQPQSLPDALEVSARTDEGEIMGVRHRDADRRRRAVPSGERAHAAGAAADGQLPAATSRQEIARMSACAKRSNSCSTAAT